MDALLDSSIKFITVRHEQGATTSVTRRPRSFRRLLDDDLGHWLNNRDIAVHIPC